MPNRKISQSATAIKSSMMSWNVRLMGTFYPERRTVKRTRQLVIRQDTREHLQWELWAAERGLTVSDLVRKAVAAYVHGRIGVPFSHLCAFASRHSPGHTCPGCGGSARPDA